MTRPSSEPPRDESRPQPAPGLPSNPPYQPYAPPGPTNQPAPGPPSNPPYAPPGPPSSPPYQPAPGPSGAGPRRTNGLAIAALVCALAGLVTAVLAPVGAVLGHVASRQITQTGEEGGQLARAAIWVGWIITGLYAVACCALLSLLIAANQAR